MASSMKMKNVANAAKDRVMAGAEKVKAVASKVYCTLCTRTVDAFVSMSTNGLGRRHLRVSPGQKCPHCASSLDAAYVMGNLS